MEPEEFKRRHRAAEEEAERVKRAPLSSEDRTLSSERNVTRFGKRKHQFGEDRRIGMKPNPIQPPKAKR